MEHSCFIDSIGWKVSVQYVLWLLSNLFKPLRLSTFDYDFHYQKEFCLTGRWESGLALAFSVSVKAPKNIVQRDQPLVTKPLHPLGTTDTPILGTEWIGHHAKPGHYPSRSGCFIPLGFPSPHFHCHHLNSQPQHLSGVMGCVIPSNIRRLKS